jgi:hypothetical protein
MFKSFLSERGKEKLKKIAYLMIHLLLIYLSMKYNRQQIIKEFSIYFMRILIISLLEDKTSPSNKKEHLTIHSSK